jgi:hypothetical protein
MIKAKSGKRIAAVAISMALTLPIGIFSPLTVYAEENPDEAIKIEVSDGNTVNETNDTDIIKNKDGLIIEASKNSSVSYTLNANIDAAKEDLGYGSYYSAAHPEASGGSQIDLKTRDITAEMGRGLRSGANDDNTIVSITTGKIKAKQGFNLSANGNGTINLTTGDIESKDSNIMSNCVYYSSVAGNILADLGDVTSDAAALSLTSRRSGTITVNAGKLTGDDALYISSFENGKINITAGDLVAKSNGIYTSGGSDSDIDVTVNGNITSENSGINLSDGGVYKVFGDVTANGVLGGLHSRSRWNDTDVLITGTLSTASFAIDARKGDENINDTFTIWKLVWGTNAAAFPDAVAFENDDEDGTFAKSVNYIIKSTTSGNGNLNLVKSDGTTPLDTKTYKHGDEDEVFRIAHEGERIIVKADVPVLKAYQINGEEKTELLLDESGNYYIDVERGGGIDLNVILEGAEIPEETKVSISAEKTAIHVGESTKVTAAVENGVGETTFSSSDESIATVSEAGDVKGINPGTVTITAENNGVTDKVEIRVDKPESEKKKNPMTVKARRIYGKDNKPVVVKRDRAFTINKAKGTLTFKKISGHKKFSIDSTTGDITIKKGLKEDKNYFMVVEVTDSGNADYKAKSIKVELRIRIK